MRDKKVSSNKILIDLIFKTISIQKMFFALKWVSRALIYFNLSNVGGFTKLVLTSLMILN